MPEPKRAVIWSAVSTKAQAEDERESLPTQEAEARAICDKNGWQVVDILIVPGHSRRYNNLYKCAEEMRAAGIDALDRLIAHWEQKDFDVLIVRDGNRFARKQGMHATIVEEVIDSGAVIYSIMDGMVDEKNFRFFIAMNGYKSAQEIDELVKKIDLGMEGRAKRGLPVSSTVIGSHTLIRDERSGRAVKLVVNEDKRRLWLDLATLLLEGKAWRALEQEMFAVYGHANPLGEPYQHHYYHKIIHTPTFWGHIARNYKHAIRGMWSIEPGHPVPPGVSIYYDKVEPVYTGELAERVKAELVRRHTVIKGSASPMTTRRFTGLFICGGCGYGMTYNQSKGWEAYQCMSKYEKSPTRDTCTVTKRVPQKQAQATLHRLLKLALNSMSLEELYMQQTGEEAVTEQIALVEREMEQTEKTLRRLILQQASADESLSSLYAEEIQSSTAKRKTLQARQRDLQQQHRRTDRQTALRGLEELKAMTLEVFWQQENRVINQTLHRLMGNRRFVVVDGEITGTMPAPQRTRRY